MLAHELVKSYQNNVHLAIESKSAPEVNVLSHCCP